jgi:hypothetical protein
MITSGHHLQVWVGLLLGTGLSAGGWLRVYATNGSVVNASAIALSLWLIVMTSVLLGTALPFALTRVRRRLWGVWWWEVSWEVAQGLYDMYESSTALHPAAH